MSDLCFEIRWQIDDVDGTKWTFLWTNTTTNAKWFWDVCDFRVRCNFDAQFASLDNWTWLFAFLTAFLENISWFVSLWILLTFGLHYNVKEHVSVVDSTVRTSSTQHTLSLLTIAILHSIRHDPTTWWSRTLSVDQTCCPVTFKMFRQWMVKERDEVVEEANKSSRLSISDCYE